jgi:hypothetical protein
LERDRGRKEVLIKFEIKFEEKNICLKGEVGLTGIRIGERGIDRRIGMKWIEYHQLREFKGKWNIWWKMMKSKLEERRERERKRWRNGKRGRKQGERKKGRLKERMKENVREERDVRRKRKRIEREKIESERS